MNNLSHRLRELMKEHGIDDTTLSKETLVPISTIARMRKDHTANPTMSSLKPIAKFFDLSIGQLLGEEPFPHDIKESHTSSTVPLISWDHISTWIHKPKTVEQHHFITANTELSEGAFALKIDSNTYGHFFQKGTIIILNVNCPARSSDYVIIEDKESHLILFKQLLIDGEDYYLKPINPDLGNIKLKSKKQTVIGVVAETRYCFQEEINEVKEPLAIRMRIGRLASGKI